jgi:hypothetical protein
MSKRKSTNTGPQRALGMPDQLGDILRDPYAKE